MATDDTHELLVEITDDSCNDGEVWRHKVPLDTSKMEIMAAIECFYPTVTSFSVTIVEIAEDEED